MKSKTVAGQSLELVASVPSSAVAEVPRSSSDPVRLLYGKLREKLLKSLLQFGNSSGFKTFNDSRIKLGKWNKELNQL